MIPYHLMSIARIEIRRRSQIMVNSHGQAFEGRCRAMAKTLGWFPLRLPTPVGYYSLKMPGDFIFFGPETLLVECKATKTKKYNPKTMRQYPKFKEFIAYHPRAAAVLIVDFIDEFGGHKYSYCIGEDIDTKILTAQEAIPDLKTVLINIMSETVYARSV